MPADTQGAAGPVEPAEPGRRDRYNPAAPAAAVVSRRSAGTAVPVAGWTFAFLVLRLFAVSGYDWETSFAASTTLSVNDGLALAFGSLLAGGLVVSGFLVCVLPLLIATYAWSANGRRATVALPTTLGLVMVIALTISFNRWWLPLAIAAILGLLVIVRRSPPEGRWRRASEALTARVGWIAAVAALLIAALVQTPWVPREHIETTDGTINGYVLSVDPGFLNVLTEDHEFVIILSGDVLSRE